MVATMYGLLYRGLDRLWFFARSSYQYNKKPEGRIPVDSQASVLGEVSRFNVDL